MTLNRSLPDEREFKRTQTEYQDKTFEVIDEYALRITDSGTIKNSEEDQGAIRSYTFTNDGDVVVGNFFTLNLHQNDGSFLHEFVGHSGEVVAVSVSADGRILASASSDQTIKLWNLSTGECLATLFVASDDEWVCWTPQGYYAASAGGEKYVGWHLNQGSNKAAKYYPVSVFRKRFHQPELVKRTITTGSFEQALSEINAESQQKIEEITITNVLPPKVHWILPKTKTVETSEPSIRIQARIQSESKLTTVKVLVNGRVQSTGRGLAVADEEPEGEDEIDREISLVPGRNEITIFAANEHAGVTSAKRIVT
jgi:WD40 repeat protein